MANICIVMGPSGTGKSTSIKGLNPEETVILNLLGKKLPFKGSSALYNTDKKNLFQVDSSDKIVALLNSIDSKAKYVKNIVIDDASYLMRKEYFLKAKERGYDKFVDIALHTQQVIETCEHLRPDLTVFIMYHSEELADNGSVIGYKVATVGKMVDQTYNPLEVVPLVLFSASEFDDKGNVSYGFYTHRTMKGNVVIPAKSPNGMFDDDFIPNDLGLVISKMTEYYN